MSNKAVIGLGFGDEGKGLVTNYLCLHSYMPLVIRYSGGQQAGHTVFKDQNSHVFSNFGSGSLNNIPTYWSKFCTIDPIGIINELSILKEKGFTPKLYIDEQCPVTTPYDICYNRTADVKNGTCGVGVGTTIQREENHYSLTYIDLFNPWILKTKLELIIKYYKYKDKDISLEQFLKSVDILISSNNIKISNGIPSGFKTHIYEGSQGLLLDQNYGFFPHVTRSNTGSKNILQLYNNEEIEYNLVTRAYQTRHGNGPMSNEDKPHNIQLNPNETNITNTYQGEFRISLLDLDLLLYGINKDENIRKSQNCKLFITCLDQIQNEYRFTYSEKIVYCKDEKEFINKIKYFLQINEVYLSHSPYSENIKLSL